MNFNLFKRVSLYLFIALFGLGTFSYTANAAEAIEQLDELIEAGHVPDPIHICGNGVLEDGEDCDHGTNNGTDGDICKSDCSFNIPEGQDECVERYILDCYSNDRIRLADTEAPDLVEAVEADDRELDNDYEECMEEAILECTPEDEPEVPDEPEPTDPPQPEEPKEQIEEAPPASFILEGSGCSLGLAGASTNGFGLIMGLGLLFLGLRRK